MAQTKPRAKQVNGLVETLGYDVYPVFATYATKAASTAAFAGIPTDAYYIVTEDESVTGSPMTRYRKTGGVAVLDANLDQLRTDLANPAAGFGADLVGFKQAGEDAITRTLKDKGRESLSVLDYGVLPGESNAAANCTAYAKLIAYVRTLAANVEIIWPRGAYHFSPKDNATYSGGANYLWRSAIELVDVNNIYHIAPGVVIWLKADAGWFRGTSTPVLGLDEGPIQFRASAPGLCKRVGLIGPCTIKTDQTIADPTGGHPDGSAMGIAYRGCEQTLTAHVRSEWWGTDGFYFGTGYGNAPAGKDHLLIDPQTYRCYRQGISIVGNDDGVILGGTLELTQGGSFGHGIDFEPDTGTLQENWRVVGLKTKDNQRGACNFINTRNVTFIAPNFDEQSSAANGVIYIDGSNNPAFDVKNIKFIGGSAVGSQAVLYITGNGSPVGGIDNIDFIDMAVGSYANALNSNSWLRVNPNGLTGARIGKITFRGGSITGNGGITIKGNGVTQAELTLKDVAWRLTAPNGSAIVFGWGADATSTVNLDRVDMSIDNTKTMATTTPYIVNGSLKNCKLSGHAGAIITWQDYGAGRLLNIGYNEFSTYNSYKGVIGALNLAIPGVVQTYGSGDFGIPFREVHGGRQRVVGYATSPGFFIGLQAPVDGDTTYNLANSGVSVVVTSYTYIGQLAAWRQSGFIMRSGSTAARPTAASYDVGIQYLDNTLSANGKLITWNGAVWVDGTGATV